MSQYRSTTSPTDVRSRRTTRIEPFRPPGFSAVEDLIDKQGDVAFIVDYCNDTHDAQFSAYAPLADTSENLLRLSYLYACDKTRFPDKFRYRLDEKQKIPQYIPRSTRHSEASTIPTLFANTISDRALSIPKTEEPVEVYVKTKKKYKPVAQKIRAMPADLPPEFRIVRNRLDDPLIDIPRLSPNPPAFRPTGRYTQERRDKCRNDHASFLWESELDLVDDLMCKQNDGFAWTDDE